ncbi:uroporphyrinogen-III C-methyltransferase [Limnohabitans sp.]|jgi:uroporphyrin-3 C-methyltransferase|uniref:uroporphyrinogen-III C-methyltransferase n=1 Tax=Limnohabitans sp. TaxID=1907725 RepID=UPI0039BCB4E0|nr:uroporphyrinogen-III C-methyltransferase [Comamonadaceae bacterium]
MTPPTADLPDAHPTGEPLVSGVSTVQRSGWVVFLLGTLALLALLSSVFLWQKLSRIQEQLARQSADSGVQALEAKTWAKQAQETVKDSAARVALLEARLAEVALQRAQLEDLMQSLSRSRDENLLVDIESALRIAQQQALMSGSTEPLVAALQSAQKRVQRTAQPRLMPLARTLEKDLERINSLPGFDLPGLMLKLDEGVALVDGLVLANAATSQQSRLSQQTEPMANASPMSWWMAGLTRMGDEFKSLLRVSRIDAPEAALLSPEQAFFVRENLKLKLLNARLGLLARQKDGVRADLHASAILVRRYAEPQSRRTLQLLQLLEQTTEQVRTAEVPRIEASLTALSTAAAGR